MPSRHGDGVTELPRAPARRHAVLGAGGVGGLLAAALAHQNEDVTIVLRPEVLESYPPWLSLDRRGGVSRVSVSLAVAVTEPYDVLWVAVKATQLDRALEAVHSDQEIGAVVPLLNGLDHIVTLRRRFGHDRVVPATIAVESERIRPGVIIQRSPFARLTVSAVGRERLAAVLDALEQFGFTCQFNADETTLLWSKLVFLAPLALTTTAAGRAIGDVIGEAEWRRRLEECASEVCAVGVACGAKVDAAQILAAFKTLPPPMRSSMQKDVAAGHVPELDAIAGPILREAETHGIKVPVTQDLAAIIRGMASGSTGA
jgi:2-dehydropantoate 2-reductase